MRYSEKQKKEIMSQVIKLTSKSMHFNKAIKLVAPHPSTVRKWFKKDREQRNERYKKDREQNDKICSVTDDNLTQHLWHFQHEYSTYGFIPFIIRGNVRWESDSYEKIYGLIGQFWLKSAYVGSLNPRNTIETRKFHEQNNLNLSEIFCGYDVGEEISNPVVFNEKLEVALSNVILLTSLLSLEFGSSLTWHPAKVVYNDQEMSYINISTKIENNNLTLDFLRNPEEMSSTLPNDKNISTILNLLNSLQSIDDEKLKNILLIAVNLYSQGNYMYSGMSRFLSFWSSIETIASYFESKKMPKNEKKKLIMNKVKNINNNNCLKIIDECKNILDSAIRTKFRSLGKFINEENLDSELFDEIRFHDKSLNDIRNDIAHGDVSEIRREYYNEFEIQLYYIRYLSRQIIHKVIKKLESEGKNNI